MTIPAGGNQVITDAVIPFVLYLEMDYLAKSPPNFAEEITLDHAARQAREHPAKFFRRVENMYQAPPFLHHVH